MANHHYFQIDCSIFDVIPGVRVQQSPIQSDRLQKTEKFRVWACTEGASAYKHTIGEFRPDLVIRSFEVKFYP